VEHYTFVFPISGPATGDPAARPAPAARSAHPRSGIIAAVRSPQGSKAHAADDQSRVLLVTAAMLALCLNVLLVFSRRLVAPLESFVKGTERIAAGDFSTPIDVGPRRDELHALADSFNRMLEKLKQQRDEILMHSRELEGKVSQRTAELVEANQRIRQAQAGLVEAEKMRMLGQLAAGVAHEINTPAAAMLNVAADAQTNLLAIVNTASRIPELPPETRQWLADLVPAILSRGLQPSDAAVRSRRRQLEQELKDGGHAEYRRMAAVIIRCGLDEAPCQGRVLAHLSREPVLALLERLEAMSSAAGITSVSAKKIARIVRALSVYTRSDEKELVEADVNETLDNTVTILQNRIKHAAEVRTEYAKGLPPVRCGADISQVWTNILNNACDAIEESSPGRLGRIDIVTALAGDRIRVTLFNTGKPIPDAVRERIFDPFFTTKPVGKGTGLGLSICAGILRDCGGTLRACNEPDGVRFEVTLPASTRKPAEAPVAASVAADG
jgi:C4-dicarboxylate-specific signal transduction histidine kinase